MCPSFRVTHEEQHSTRGRAHLLEEMLTASVITKGWKDEAVHEALSLCLACKGCKGDCPMNVDMATYKAEFLSHHYRGRLRPRAAYAMGLIFRWARLASAAPRIANFFGQTWPFATLAKKLAGVAPQRTLPRFAPETFRAWFRRRGARGDGARPVLLWPDTFTNHFHPEIAKAAVAALEAAGATVRIPPRVLCCGRPTSFPRALRC